MFKLAAIAGLALSLLSSPVLAGGGASYSAPRTTSRGSSSSGGSSRSSARIKDATAVRAVKQALDKRSQWTVSLEGKKTANIRGFSATNKSGSQSKAGAVEMRKGYLKTGASRVTIFKTQSSFGGGGKSSGSSFGPYRFGGSGGGSSSGRRLGSGGSGGGGYQSSYGGGS